MERGHRNQWNEEMQTILTAANFHKEVLENLEPVLVQFGAQWSGACQMLAPVFEQLHEEFDGKIKLTWLDVQAHERIAAAYGIQDLPTLLFFKQGRVIDQIIGVAPRQVIAAKLHALLR